MNTVPEILLFGYGNPGRGDDALGPMMVEAIEKEAYPQVECLTDMQLQVEHAMDLEHRRQIIFVDADMSCRAPYEYAQLAAEKDGSYTSHAMTPSALLYAYRRVFERDAPPAYLLRIRGYDFELGAPLGGLAEKNLKLSRKFIASLLESRLKDDIPHQSQSRVVNP